MGVACFDCHVNGHTTGQFHLSPDIRPQERRFRLDTTSLRGMFNQQIHGSKRSLRSRRGLHRVRAADGVLQRRLDPRDEEGVPGDPAEPRAAHGAGAEHVRLPAGARSSTCSAGSTRRRRNEQELRGEKLFFGKAKCAVCHPAPFYLDHQMHDLQLERFLDEPGDGPIKSFTLRGIKESPPYLHDGRCLTLEDTVEFFNLVLELNLTQGGEGRPGRVPQVPVKSSIAWY